MDTIPLNHRTVESPLAIYVWETIKPNKHRIGPKYTCLVNVHVLEYYKPIKFVFGGILNNSQVESSLVDQPYEIHKLSRQSKSTWTKTHQVQTCHCVCQGHTSCNCFDLHPCLSCGRHTHSEKQCFLRDLLTKSMRCMHFGWIDHFGWQTETCFLSKSYRRVESTILGDSPSMPIADVDVDRVDNKLKITNIVQ